MSDSLPLADKIALRDRLSRGTFTADPETARRLKDAMQRFRRETLNEVGKRAARYLEALPNDGWMPLPEVEGAKEPAESDKQETQ